MNSLIGIHTTGGVPIEWLEQTVRDGKPLAVVKSVDNPGVCIDVKRVSPSTITIARFTPEINLQEISDNPDVNIIPIASQIIDQILNRTNAVERQSIDYYEVCNEPDPPEVWGYVNLARLMQECMHQANFYGFKLALFAFNLGSPDWDEMVAIRDTGVFEDAYNGGHVITFHEGDRYGPMVSFGSIPDAPFVEGAGPNSFRHRYLYSLIPVGQRPGCVISEFYGGYSDTFDAQIIANRWADYDREFAKRSYSKGFGAFTVRPTAEWVNQNYDSIFPMMLGYLADVDYPDPIDEEIEMAYSVLTSPRPAKNVYTYNSVPSALNVRDLNNDVVGSIAYGETVNVWETNLTVIGGGKSYSDRAYIQPVGSTRNHIWDAAPPDSQTKTLEYL